MPGNSKERPIIFTGENVLKILRGEKTQTRRIIKPQPIQDERYGKKWMWPSVEKPRSVWSDGQWNCMSVCCPYGKIGDTLWIKEKWRATGNGQLLRKGKLIDSPRNRDQVVFAADEPTEGPWKSPLFMPRRISRVTLDIMNVRVQRLQDISEEDAQAEGAERECSDSEQEAISSFTETGYSPPDWAYTHKQGFERSWSKINGTASWESNPWVWCLSFKVKK